MISLPGNMEIHPSLNKIVINKAGEKQTINIENQLMKLLVLMVNNRGQLVTKEKFIDEIWDGNHHVGEQALTRNIFKLRELFKNHGVEDSIQIETIPKKGYRIIIREKKNSILLQKRSVFLLIIIPVIVIAVIGLWQTRQRSTNDELKLIEYDETNQDTIIQLDKDNPVQVIRIDSVTGEAIEIDN